MIAREGIELCDACSNSSDFARCMLFAVSANPAGAFFLPWAELFNGTLLNLSTGLSFSLLS
jgi:hypothetical protein